MTQPSIPLEDTAERPPGRADHPDHTARRLVGLVLGGLTGAFLAFDGVSHVLMVQPVIDSSTALGYPLHAIRLIGALELVCLALYLIPSTCLLGAVLLTGYLGGAMSAQVRIDSPLWSTVLFPVYLGVVLWTALGLRDPDLIRLGFGRVRADRRR